MRSRFLFRLVALFASLSGLAGGPIFAQERQTNDDALSARSEVAGIAFVTRDQLPRAPATASSQTQCEGMLVKPTTPGGRTASSLGWGVTGEVALGAYDAVSFAGQFEPSTSGSCEVSHGNVAIFKGPQLIALAYAAKGSKQTIGSIAALQDGLRVWDGDIVPAPVGDLAFIDGHRFQIVPVANEDPICAGRGTVPNIFGKPIDQARQALIGKGWAPLKNPHDLAADKSQYFRELDLSQRGVVEVDSCSGTGFAFCLYYYRRADLELSVTTSGDNDFPNVVRYDARCDRAHWHQPR